MTDRSDPAVGPPEWAPGEASSRARPEPLARSGACERAGLALAGLQAGGCYHERHGFIVSTRACGPGAAGALRHGQRQESSRGARARQAQERTRVCSACASARARVLMRERVHNSARARVFISARVAALRKLARARERSRTPCHRHPNRSAIGLRLHARSRPKKGHQLARLV